MDVSIKAKVKSLLLKGFNKEEIKVLLNNNDEKLINRCIKETNSMDIGENSVELYSELQKDLSKLVFNEMNNKEKKDPNVILNAIKLQSELQEKKIMLTHGKGKHAEPIKVSKQYIYERDQEIVKLIQQGVHKSEIAKRFNISEMTITWAMDRVNLNLPENLKVLGPTIICETMGLEREERLKLLKQALDQGLTKMQMRDIVTGIKNSLNETKYNIQTN